MKLNKRLYPIIILIICKLNVYAQNNTTDSKLTISGYLQSQFQVAQDKGIYSWSGGDFDSNSSNRFLIRRARLKAIKTHKFIQLVAQIDAKPEGIQLIDGYVQLENKQKEISFTTGLFNRPFGYAITYSSGKRDFPESPMVFQNLFSREKDMGAMISFRPKTIIPFLSTDIALINGSGLSFKDFDSNKDFIGNLRFDFDKLCNNKLQIGFGASIYLGSIINTTNTYYKSSSTGFQKTTGNDIINKVLERNYYGLNLQSNYKSALGITEFKTEYLQGKQPGILSTSSISPILATKSFTSQPKTDLYLRNFEGYYFWLSQQLGQNSNIRLLLSYNVYDPNSSINGSLIGVSNNYTNAADIKFSTWGYGIAWDIEKDLKATLFYDQVQNEKTLLHDYLKDRKDDVFTLRLQYKW